MPKVLVWKCPHTGKLFEDEKKYRNHLNKLARYRISQRKLQKERDATRAWWEQAQNIEMSIDNFKQWIIDNQMQFWQDAATWNQYDWRDVGKKTRNGVVMPIPELLEFKTFHLSWRDNVSNTHSCPHNGVTNWGRRNPEAPLGYPGWRGRVEWKCKWPKEFSTVYRAGDLFSGRDCRINTGTGGCGQSGDGFVTHGYDIEIFAADWPGLARFREKQLVWDALNKEYV